MRKEIIICTNMSTRIIMGPKFFKWYWNYNGQRNYNAEGNYNVY